MIVWVKPGGDRPNRQRAKLVSFSSEGTHAAVEFFRINGLEVVNVLDICGVEFEDKGNKIGLHFKLEKTSKTCST